MLVAHGLTNRQIAAAAHISERTAETHVQHILDKLGLRQPHPDRGLGRRSRKYVPDLRTCTDAPPPDRRDAERMTHRNHRP